MAILIIRFRLIQNTRMTLTQRTTIKMTGESTMLMAFVRMKMHMEGQFSSLHTATVLIVHELNSSENVMMTIKCQIDNITILTVLIHRLVITTINTIMMASIMSFIKENINTIQVLFMANSGLSQMLKKM